MLPDTSRQPTGDDQDLAAREVVVVPQSRARRDVMFGTLLVVFAVALVRGVTGASTTAGEVAVTAVMGLILSVIAVAWVRAILHPAHLEIRPDLSTTRVPRAGPDPICSKTAVRR